MMEVIIGLINFENISEKNIFFDALNKKFDTLIKLINNITTVNNLNQIIKISAKIALMNLNFEEKEKKFDFIKKLSQLNNEISILIFIEIIKICLEHKNIKNEELSNLKDNIFITLLIN